MSDQHQGSEGSSQERALGAASPELTYIGLGANLGDRLTNLREAVWKLSELAIGAVRCSSVWETEPVGPVDQPRYLNAALELTTVLGTAELLDRLHAIERLFGRERGGEIRWGPRILDLDLLFHGQRVVERAGVSVPHPRLAERRFVLEPLCELAPRWRHPVLDTTVEELLAALRRSEVEDPGESGSGAGTLVCPRASRWWIEP